MFLALFLPSKTWLWLANWMDFFSSPLNHYSRALKKFELLSKIVLFLLYAGMRDISISFIQNERFFGSCLIRLKRNVKCVSFLSITENKIFWAENIQNLRRTIFIVKKMKTLHLGNEYLCTLWRRFCERTSVSKVVFDVSCWSFLDKWCRHGRVDRMRLRGVKVVHYFGITGSNKKKLNKKLNKIKKNPSSKSFTSFEYVSYFEAKKKKIWTLFRWRLSYYNKGKF